jgi:polyphosphate kinase
MHFGTGNYNEITAKLYSDISFFTADPDLGVDASAFFNAITGRSEPLPFRKISAAPVGLRETLIGLVEAETQRAKQGQKAWIKAKMNSIEDVAIINSLYAASRAGVKVSLNVRGICCLVPDVKGHSDNIRVVSIVDRFLEHARIIAFHHGGRPLTFISSADWMPRNLDKRVELLVPIEDNDCRDRILDFLDIWMNDTVNSWRLQSDGAWLRTTPESPKKSLRSQELLYTTIKDEIKSSARGVTMFKPYNSAVRKKK